MFLFSLALRSLEMLVFERDLRGGLAKPLASGGDLDGLAVWRERFTLANGLHNCFEYFSSSAYKIFVCLFVVPIRLVVLLVGTQ